MKKLSILLLILLSFGLLSCEMTVGQDESALEGRLEGIDSRLDDLDYQLEMLGGIVESNYGEFEAEAISVANQLNAITDDIILLEDKDIELANKIRKLKNKLNRFKNCIKGRVTYLEDNAYIGDLPTDLIYQSDLDTALTTLSETLTTLIGDSSLAEVWLLDLAQMFEDSQFLQEWYASFYEWMSSFSTPN